MTVNQLAISKLEQLSEPLAQEVNDFIDFLLLRRDADRWRQWSQFREAQNLVESDFADYAANLSDYEERLARGEIRW